MSTQTPTLPVLEVSQRDILVRRLSGGLGYALLALWYWRRHHRRTAIQSKPPPAVEQKREITYQPLISKEIQREKGTPAPKEIQSEQETDLPQTYSKIQQAMLLNGYEAAIAEGQFRLPTLRSLHPDVAPQTLAEELLTHPLTWQECPEPQSCVRLSQLDMRAYLTNGKKGYKPLQAIVSLNNQEVWLELFSTTDYLAGDWLTDYYQEEARQLAANSFRAKTGGVSPIELWKKFSTGRRHLLMTALDRTLALDPEVPLNEHLFQTNIHNLLFERKYVVSDYHISWALAIIKKFEEVSPHPIQYILDPFAGWGGRLLAACLLRKGYDGFDPNPYLQPGYQQMIKDFGAGLEVQVTETPFEEAKLERIYDLLLTSPPYIDLEVYIPKGMAGSERQSIARMQSRDTKLWGAWYRQALEKALAQLRPGSFAIFQVNDKPPQVLIVQLTIDILGGRYRGQFPIVSSKSYVNIHIVAQV